MTEQFDLKHRQGLLKNFLTHTTPHESATLCEGERCHGGVLYAEGCSPPHSQDGRARDGGRIKDNKCATVISSYPGEYDMGYAGGNSFF